MPSLRLRCLGLLALPLVLAAGAAGAGYRVYPDRPLQRIWGLGFEIQSDSIGSGNQGLPDSRVAVCRTISCRRSARVSPMRCSRASATAGSPAAFTGAASIPRGNFCARVGRSSSRSCAPCWIAPGSRASPSNTGPPAPFWKANGRYVGRSVDDATNVLRCFGPDFARDPVYRGDVGRFLADFAAALATDVKTLQAAGLKVAMWGLQNEPHAAGSGYSRCPYPDSSNYARAYVAAATAIRRVDANILLISDTDSHFPRRIGPAMRDPSVAALVDAYVVHTIGADSENVRAVQARITAELPPRPWFQNEYEYLTGGATPERCLNTVQHIMNSFQLAANPTWFWLHALKPFKNAEASGYSLGFWRSREEPGSTAGHETPQRWRDGPELGALPAGLRTAEIISATRGDPAQPGSAFNFSVNQPVTVWLLAEDWGDYTPGPPWELADVTAPTRAGGTDRLYRRSFPPGQVEIPTHSGRRDRRYGAPHLAFVQPSAPATFQAMIGINLPIQIRSETLALERSVARLEPGHWTYNRHNWHAVGSFVKRLPWDSTAVAVDEPRSDPRCAHPRVQTPQRKTHHRRVEPHGWRPPLCHRGRPAPRGLAGRALHPRSSRRGHDGTAGGRADGRFPGARTAAAELGVLGGTVSGARR
jgi:hypothetical protein